MAEAFDEYCEQSKTHVKYRNLLGYLFHITFGDFCNLPFEAKRKADKMNKNDDDGEENEQTEFSEDEDEDEEKDTRSSTINLSQLMSLEDIFLKSLDFSHLINVIMNARYFGEEGYFIVQLVRSLGFVSAQNLDVKL